VAGIIDLVSIGTTAFVVTNIDDLFILMVFFSKPGFSHIQIILGQYVGMGLLLAISLIGSLIALVIPQNLIGLVGLIPIAIGVKELLVEMRSSKNANYDSDDNAKVVNRLSKSRWRTYLPFLAVTSVTFSGGEEIGIYTSIFVIYDGLSEIIVIVLTVMILTGGWCIIGFYLVNHNLLATRFRRLADRVLPLVLIALGTYILAEAFLVPFFQN
jgi:cadmium resistance protein CadD (predicted permease)